MRHLLVLSAATLVFVLITAVSWKYDASRATQSQRDQQQAVDGRLLALEINYLQGAHTLLSVIVARQSSGAASASNTLQTLADNVEAAISEFPSQQDIDARKAAFENLQNRIQIALLQQDPTSLGDAVAQEWRRQTDRMNGALHRRRVLVEQMEE
ncbi:similar to phage-associated protein [gamma proteobacterium HdN1]|nr:similar to phage-associated protein [gamma proteobacterium HdN1]